VNAWQFRGQHQLIIKRVGDKQESLVFSFVTDPLNSDNNRGYLSLSFRWQNQKAIAMINRLLVDK